MQPAASRHHVVFCSNAGYMPYVGVAAYSLLANTPPGTLEIVIIGDGVDADNKRRFDRLADEFRTRISLRVPQEKDLAALRGVAINAHYSLATYYRVLIPQLLPDVGMALYLDADLVIDGDITPLLSTDLGDRAVGVCRDPIGCAVRGRPDYFNAGVMLMNLRRWNELDIARRVVAFGAGRRDAEFEDQDALNLLLRPEHVMWLDQAYNALVSDRARPEFREGVARALGAIEVPKIIHFAGVSKPWHAWFSSPLKAKYADYVRRSPWSDAPLWKDEPSDVRETLWLANMERNAGEYEKAAHRYRIVLTHLLHSVRTTVNALPPEQQRLFGWLEMY
jgi:lipopolysaccharide biosynthesis glycosyltransferase